MTDILEMQGLSLDQAEDGPIAGSSGQSIQCGSGLSCGC